MQNQKYIIFQLKDLNNENIKKNTTKTAVCDRHQYFDNNMDNNTQSISLHSRYNYFYGRND